MPITRVIIVGAGGFGREALDVLRAMDPEGESVEFVGFVSDDEPDAGMLARIDASWLGNDDAFLAAPSASHYVLGIGAPAVRRRLVERFDAAGLTPMTLIHPTALIGHDVELGEGTVMCGHSSVTTNIRVGRHVHLDRMTTIGHDSVIDDFVTVHPGAVVSGSVTIHSGTRLGTTSCVLPGVTVGRDVMIGAGAVVTKDVADGLTVVGVPARPMPDAH